MKIHKKSWLLIFSIVAGLALTGCAANSSKPKQPSTYPRVPINKQIPEELENYINDDRIEKN